MTTTDPVRDYLRHFAADNLAAWSAAAEAMSAEDRDLIANYNDAFDTHATKNSGLLADIADAVYGKGTAEAKGYPRGMVAKVRRVFNLLRQCKRQGYLSLTHEHRLISEVK